MPPLTLNSINSNSEFNLINSFQESYLNTHFSNLESLEFLSGHLKEAQSIQDTVKETVNQLQSSTPAVVKEIHETCQGLLFQVSLHSKESLELTSAIQKFVHVPNHSSDSSDLKSNSSLTSGFIQGIEVSNSQLLRLQISKLYLEALLQTDDFHLEFEKSITSRPESALIPYQNLVTYFHSIRLTPLDSSSSSSTFTATQSSSPSPSLSQSPCLQQFILSVLNTMFIKLSETLGKNVHSALRELNWPQSIQVSPSTPLNLKLKALKLSLSQAFLSEPPHPSSLIGNPYHSPYLPIQLILELPIKKFKYHFFGLKPTNRPDKPEWFLTSALELMRSHNEFLNWIQGIGNEVIGSEWDAKTEFMSHILETILQKLNFDLPYLMNQPQHLIHYFDEVLRFDKILREVECFRPRRHSNEKEWGGCISLFLENSQIFNQWVQVEIETAQNRFNILVVLPETSWDLLFESQDNIVNYEDVDEFKTTQAADAVVGACEDLIERYRLLPSTSHWLHFFRDVQLLPLVSFLSLIESGIKDMENSMGRFKIGLSSFKISQTWLNALERLERTSSFSNLESGGKNGKGKIILLCRFASSLKYIKDVMGEWGEDVFFLSVWRTISQSLKRIPSISLETEDSKGLDLFLKEGTIFDDAMEDYQKLLERAMDLIAEDVGRGLREVFRPYEKKRTWNLPMISTSPSSELYLPLLHISSTFSLLQTNLPKSLFTIILKRALQSLESWLLDSVVYSQMFSHEGGKNFHLDMTQLEKTILNWTPNSHLSTLLESSKVLSWSQSQLLHLNSSLTQIQKQGSNSLGTSLLEDQTLESFDLWRLDIVSAGDVIRRRTDI